MIVLLIGGAGFAIGFGAFTLSKLGLLQADRIRDPLITMTVAGCTLVCQLSGEQLPSIATQCAWMAIGVVTLVQVLVAGETHLRSSFKDGETEKYSHRRQ